MTTEEAVKILKGAIKQPNPEDGYIGQALTMAIKALEQQPCEDCISRQEAISAIQDEYYADAVGIDIVDIIAYLPSVTPKGWSGDWEYVQYDTPNIGNWHCSRCRELYYSTDKPRWNYCPNCGAKMEVEDE